MWSSTSTVSARISLQTLFLLLGLAVGLAGESSAQLAAPRPPTEVVAGNDFSVSTTGSGKAIFYLAGPGSAAKRQVDLGQDIYIKGEDASSAGRYLAILCSETCQSTPFWVTPAQPASLNFLVHPSRAPVQAANVISGVAIPFDRSRNMVLTPTTVNFKFSVAGAEPTSHSVVSQSGIAWFRASSGRMAGAGQMLASIGDIEVRRVVRQVASDPCNLRIRARRDARNVLVETDPVRDCAGNPVPDGTIVTFTMTDGEGKSSVDAPIKQGVARAQMTGTSEATISVASGIVMGNPIRVAP